MFFFLFFADFFLFDKARFCLVSLSFLLVVIKKRSKSSCVRTFNNQYQLWKKDEKKSPNYLDSMFRSSTFAPAFERERQQST